MSLQRSLIDLSDFNPDRDKIALMLKSFTVKRNDGGLFKKKKFSEPYILSLAVAQNGAQIEKATRDYPNTKTGEPYSFAFDGMILYEGNPGDFLVFSVLMMESDKDIREAGAKMDAVIGSPEAKNIIGMLAGGNPTVALATTVLQSLTSLLSKSMKENKDDELVLVQGTLLKNIIGAETLPFRVNETISSGNPAADMTLTVLPIAGTSRRKKRTVGVPIE